MAQLAKSVIEVKDESAYGAGANAIVPLYVFATQSNKVLDTSTGEIAPGTTIANELLVMTSQRDVINTFGVPYFEEENGTVHQGSELNEVGLLGLYSAMGSSALAYALRADIDLSQLKPSKTEPKSDPKNGVKYFDIEASNIAVYRRNTNHFTSPYEIRNWDRETIEYFEVIKDNTDVSKFAEGTILYDVTNRIFYEVKNGKVSSIQYLQFATYNNIPSVQTEGYIWIQTDSVSDGSVLIKKTYNSTYANWTSMQMGFYNADPTDTTGMLDGTNIVVGNSSSKKLEIKKFDEKNNKFITDNNVKSFYEDTLGDPAEGTLWYDDSDKVDMYVNKIVNNESIWEELISEGDNKNLYVQADAPETPNNLDIWVDTNDTTYPTIYRYINNTWVKIDNSDNTTAFGVIFNDIEDADATKYPTGILLFNMRESGKVIKKYDGSKWVTASGNAEDGSGLFGANAQRKMVVDALNGAINSCEELKSLDYDFFYACCPGYPEADVALNDLNEAKKEMFYIVSDTPKNLKPTGRAIIDWGTNANNVNHGLDGRVIRSAYMTRQYPPMGMGSNVDGTSVAIPTSIVKMKNLLNLPTGQICAGTQYGVVSNIGSTGYITDENEYATVSVNTGLGEVIVGQAMNPIMMRRNTGLLFWGENTENDGNTSLSDEHAILTILRLKRELETAVQPFFFRKNTPATRADFNYVLRTILNSYVANEELYDYVLDTETPNTAETISKKELHAVIAIEIVKGIEFIYIPISVVNTGTLSDQSLIA